MRKGGNTSPAHKWNNPPPTTKILPPPHWAGGDFGDPEKYFSNEKNGKQKTKKPDHVPLGKGVIFRNNNAPEGAFFFGGGVVMLPEGRSLFKIWTILREPKSYLCGIFKQLLYKNLRSKNVSLSVGFGFRGGALSIIVHNPWNMKFGLSFELCKFCRPD